MNRFSDQKPRPISIPSGLLNLQPAIKVTDIIVLEPDLDRVCRLLLASERSLALINRRALAATLANVPPAPGQVLPPAPPFAEAVAIAREDGQVVERTRLFLATHPRAIEELTPELIRTLVHIFDPTGRTTRLIHGRSPYWMFAAAGVALMGAIALLVSTTILVEHMITDSHKLHLLALHAGGRPPHQQVAKQLTPKQLTPKTTIARPLVQLPQPTHLAQARRPMATVLEATTPGVVRPPSAAPRPTSVALRPQPAMKPAELQAAPTLPAPPTISPSTPPTPLVVTPAQLARNDEASRYVFSMLSSENPTAQVNWVHASRISPELITVRVSLQNDDTTTALISYTLRDSGTDFTVLHTQQ